MNVAYCCSDQFAEICGVSIESLLESNTEEEDISVYVIESSVSDQGKSRMERIASRFGRRLEFIRMPDQREAAPEIAMNLGHTFARMLLGDLLPESVERVLSLDSDTLVVDSLKEMYATELAGSEYAAGVYDCVGSAVQDRLLHAPADLEYCNAGVFLIDLRKWRERGVGKKLLETATQASKAGRTMFFLEQDAMNLTFYGHLRVLAPRYNVLTSVCLFEHGEIMRMKRPSRYYGPDEIAAAKIRPAIVHATTCFYVRKRMWIAGSDSPYAAMYKSYRDKTPWSSERMMPDLRRAAKKARASLWHFMPRSFAVAIASFMINKLRPSYAKFVAKLKFDVIANQS